MVENVRNTYSLFFSSINMNLITWTIMIQRTSQSRRNFGVVYNPFLLFDANDKPRIKYFFPLYFILFPICYQVPRWKYHFCNICIRKVLS